MAATGLLSGSPVRQRETRAQRRHRRPGPRRLAFAGAASIRSAGRSAVGHAPRAHHPWRDLRADRPPRRTTSSASSASMAHSTTTGAFIRSRRTSTPNTATPAMSAATLPGSIRIGTWPGGDRSAAPNAGTHELQADSQGSAIDLMGAAGTTRRERHLPHRRRRADPSGGPRDRRVPDRKHGQPHTQLDQRGRGTPGMDLGTRVAAALPGPGDVGGSVIAATFRFGSFTCSIGHGAPVATSCPRPRPTPRKPLCADPQPERAGTGHTQNTVARQLQRGLPGRSLLPRRGRIQGALRSHQRRQRILRAGQIELQPRPRQQLVDHPEHPTGRNSTHPIIRAVQLHLRRIQGPIHERQPSNTSTPRIGDRRHRETTRTTRRAMTNPGTSKTRTPSALAGCSARVVNGRCGRPALPFRFALGFPLRTGRFQRSPPCSARRPRRCSRSLGLDLRPSCSW